MFSNRLLQAIYEWSHPTLAKSTDNQMQLSETEITQIQTVTQISEAFRHKIDKSIPNPSIPLSGKSFLAGYQELSVCACHPELSLEKPLRIELVSDVQRQAEQYLKLIPAGKTKSIRLVSVGSGMLLQEALLVLALAEQADVIYLDLIDPSYSFGHPNLSILIDEFTHLISEHCEHELICGTLVQNAASRLIQKSLNKPCSDSSSISQESETEKKRCIIQFFHKIDVYVPFMRSSIYQQGLETDSVLLPQVGIEVDVYTYNEHGHCNVNRLMSQMPNLSAWYNISTEVDEKTSYFTGIRFQKSVKVNEDWLNVASEPVSHKRLLCRNAS